jgi:hypothetical protein
MRAARPASWRRKGHVVSASIDAINGVRSDSLSSVAIRTIRVEISDGRDFLPDLGAAWPLA